MAALIGRFLDCSQSLLASPLLIGVTELDLYIVFMLFVPFGAFLMDCQTNDMVCCVIPYHPISLCISFERGNNCI